MAAFVTAYLIVWTFVAAYVFRLRGAHEVLTRRIRALEDHANELENQEPRSRAA